MQKRFQNMRSCDVSADDSGSLVGLVHELGYRACDRVDCSQDGVAVGLLDAIHKALGKFLSDAKSQHQEWLTEKRAGGGTILDVKGGCGGMQRICT